MKIRNSFVTNSSSSSYVITQNEYRKPLTKRKIKKVIDNGFKTYIKMAKSIFANEEQYVKGLKERAKDYKIFRKGEYKEIAEALRNEFWSASGVVIPDEIHNVFSRIYCGNIYKRPSNQEVLKAYKELESFVGKKQAKEIFDIDNYESKTPDEQYEADFNYYDEEYQTAIRGDYCIITGENAIPYELVELFRSILNAECYHLG